MQIKNYKMNFVQMQQGRLYKIILWFVNDPDKFFERVSVMLTKKYEDYPYKQYFDVKSKNHMNYFVTRFLTSAMICFVKNAMVVLHPDLQYHISIDQLGFILGIFRKRDADALNNNVKNRTTQLPTISDVMPKEVRQLFLQVFGKQYFQRDQKRKIDLRISHGGTRPVECTLGVDISTSVVGLSIFQNINKKPILLKAIQLTKICKKLNVQTLQRKLKVFIECFEIILKQKNIKITNMYIEQQRKAFGACTTAWTLNKLRKFNGMVSAYLIYRLKDIKDFAYIPPRSRRKLAYGKAGSKQQAYEEFKKCYKDIMTTDYIQIKPKQINMDISDAFTVARAGIIKNKDKDVARKPKDSIRRTKKKVG